MDKKGTIIGTVAVFLLCMGYWLFLRYEYKLHPNWNPDYYAQHPAEENQAIHPSAQMNAGTEPAPSPATTQSSIEAAGGSGGLAVATSQPSGKPVTLGSDQWKDASYALALSISPQGAALNSATINSYKNTDANGLYVFQTPLDVTEYSSLGTRSVTVDGKTISLSGVNWQLESQDGSSSATYGVTVEGAGHKPLLHLDKIFQVSQRGPASGRDNTAAGYQVAVTYRVQNLSGHALKNVQIGFDGPTMPPREMERTDDRQIVAGYDKGNDIVDVTRDYLAEFKPGAQDKDLTSHNGQKFLWAGLSSNYFAAIIQPERLGELGYVQAVSPNPDAPPDERAIALHFDTSELNLAPGASADLPIDVFFGPKDRALMEGGYYGEFPREYSSLLTTSSSFCGICAFSWLVDLLVTLLGMFHFVLRDWGLSIIALVVLVRALLHPISKSSQVSMLELQKMGPEMERLKKKYGNDKEALAKAQMEMHKEMGITPFLGCLPMFLQMPIWIALYSALQSDIALRQAPFLWGLTWIHDLARPDRLITWDSHPFTVPILGMKVMSLNVLPLLVAVVMFLQQKLQPQPPATTPEQASQQKMMRFMSLAFSLFFYWMPSGLNLYILTSSTIAIFESKIIRKHIKEKQDAEKAGKVIVDAKRTRGSKQMQKREVIAQEDRAGCLGGVWANLQEKAEEVRREAEKKPKR